MHDKCHTLGDITNTTASTTLKLRKLGAAGSLVEASFIGRRPIDRRHRGAVEPQVDGQLSVHGSPSLDPLSVHLALIGVDFEVHEPPELVEDIRRLAERFSRACRRSGSIP